MQSIFRKLHMHLQNISRSKKVTKAKIKDRAYRLPLPVHALVVISCIIYLQSTF